MSDYYIYNGELYSAEELAHHGVKGMKWGVRRYQNKDGSLTPAGQKRYGDAIDQNYDKASSTTKKVMRDFKDLSDQEFKSKYAASKARYGKRVEKYGDPYMKAPLAKLGKKLGGVNNKYDKKLIADNEKGAKATAAKGAKATGKIVKTLGSAYIADQVLYGGKGTQLAKAAVLTAGRAAVTAYVMSRGGYDIKWYNRQGKRVG